MIRIVPTGDIGFDVILGGGCRLVERLDGKESATVVIRGGPGTGKTLLAVDVALALAKALKGDVVVACVELLPTEFAAQIEAGRSELSAIALPRTTPLEVSESPRIICGLLPELKEESPDLVTALESLDTEARSLNGNPKVFIVDSLIAGYGLGPTSPRQNVDAVMKFAANGGLGIVLCEETTDDTPTVWDFAADTVLALEQQREGGRQILVRKHRYGPSATGAHEFEILGTTQPRVYPRPDAWLSGPHVYSTMAAYGWPVVQGQSAPAVRWAEDPTGAQPTREIISALVLVRGADPERVRTVAYGLLPARTAPPRDLLIGLDPTRFFAFDGAPIQPTVRLLSIAAGVRAAICELVKLIGAEVFGRDGRLPIRRIVIGDAGRIAAFAGHSRWAEGIGVIASLVANSRCGVPVIVYDSSLATAEHGSLAALRWHADLLIEAQIGTNAWSVTSRIEGTSETLRWPNPTPAK